MASTLSELVLAGIVVEMVKLGSSAGYSFPLVVLSLKSELHSGGVIVSEDQET